MTTDWASGFTAGLGPAAAVTSGAASGHQARLAVGLAEYLAGVPVLAGLGMRWRPDGPAYTAAELGVFLFHFPDTPDRALSISVYLGGRDADEQGSWRVQLRMRWPGQNPLPVMNLSDAIQDVLHDRTMWELSTGVRISQSLLVSSGSLGNGSGQRWSWADNYEFDADRPTN